MGILDDLRVKTAHDARDGDGNISVADHQGIGVDMTLYTVKGGKLKFLIKTLDADILDLSGIESVHRLAHLEHEIVGHIGKEVDRSHAAVEKADTHIHRADRAGDVLEL